MFTSPVGELVVLFITITAHVFANFQEIVTVEEFRKAGGI